MKTYYLADRPAVMYNENAILSFVDGFTGDGFRCYSSPVKESMGIIELLSLDGSQVFLTVDEWIRANTDWLNNQITNWQ